MCKGTLFLICPECHIEQTINQHFQGESYFLTSLGTVFNINEDNYIKSIIEFIEYQDIKNIVIVNDCSCRFINSVVGNEKGFETRAEEILRVLHLKGIIEILPEKHLHKRAQKLAELNIQHQVRSIKEISFFFNKIKNKEIEIKGMIYEREIDSFYEVTI